MMKGTCFSLVASFLLLSACSQEEVYIPDGNAAAGKAVFEKYQCYGCHDVVGADYPPPSSITPTFVAIGATGEPTSRVELMEAIIAPSHEFAKPTPPPGERADQRNIRSGSGSRMTDFSKQMTVRELLDLLTYLESLHEQSGTEPAS